MYGSEGNYGLVLVGSLMCRTVMYLVHVVMATTLLLGLHHVERLRLCVLCCLQEHWPVTSVIDGVTRRMVGSNVPYPNGALQEIEIFTLDELIANKGAELPTARCRASATFNTVRGALLWGRLVPS